MLILSLSTSAQTFSEWFRQKSTQKKYLTQQIAALQVYKGYLTTGYRVARSGLGSIGGSIGKELGLHQNYYEHLNEVSSVIKNDPRTKDILKWQSDIISQSKRMRTIDGLSREERNFVDKVGQVLMEDCEARLKDLQTIITDGKIKMSDEERMRQVGRLHIAMQDNYRFVTTFLRQLNEYVSNKTREQRDVNSLNRFYEGH
ncbi:MAG: hypothetical protein JKY70_06905 [Mucilaginibacter sp.]|nr:hypothetical protein [Mucilaginibacter sp.]